MSEHSGGSIECRIVIDSTGLQFFGAGEWARAKHGETRRSWCRLHLPVNTDIHEIVAHELIDNDTSDAAMIGEFVVNSGGNIRVVIIARGRMAWYRRHRSASARWSRPPTAP